MQTDPDSRWWNFAGISRALNVVDEFARRVQRVLTMIANDQRRAEYRHESVAKKFVHDPVVSIHDSDCLAPEPVQIINDRARRPVFAVPGEIANIEHENADIAQL